ncbi:hydrolethalus syndrome protein 1 homolog isoform X2 [Anoplophora glabripennis]|uniref:hydrolethalus syndrome protein 1 homolog isoform X2 n=1 Tax=Anoplophora glabripennis TaxID=217634 RepID=UPI000873B629|nr:hydrolethalus syndrome protein 1 homolog isoform X2 [Anoplophora glabripennis]
MSQKIDPREVLTYLNELGYTNINAQQLKDFITDLKKLIKHENKRRQKENTGTVTSNFVPTIFLHNPYGQTHINDHSKSKEQCCNHPLCPSNQANTRQKEEEQEDVFSHLHSQHTVASRAKEMPRREKHISVHIKKPKNKADMHDHCTHLARRSNDEDQQKEDLQLIQNIETVSDGSRSYVNTESTIKSIDATSKQSIVTKPSTSKKKSKVIRCGSAKSINKSDPVALYHYYQKQWKKQKFPGQENHADLRWSVREKLLSGPKVDVHSLPSTFRRRCNSWK